MSVAPADNTATSRVELSTRSWKLSQVPSRPRTTTTAKYDRREQRSEQSAETCDLRVAERASALVVGGEEGARELVERDLLLETVLLQRHARCAVTTTQQGGRGEVRCMRCALLHAQQHVQVLALVPHL